MYDNKISIVVMMRLFYKMVVFCLFVVKMHSISLVSRISPAEFSTLKPPSKRIRRQCVSGRHGDRSFPSVSRRSVQEEVRVVMIGCDSAGVGARCKI